MILTTEQISNLLDENGFYKCQLITRQLGYDIFGDDVSPLGNILCFEAPIVIGEIKLSRALVLTAQVSNVNSFGGICFQRLYCAQLGSLLCSSLEKEGYVKESSIYMEDHLASITITNQIKNAFVFKVIFSLEDSQPVLKLDFSPEKLEEFKRDAVASFEHLNKSIFLQTQRDNI